MVYVERNPVRAKLVRAAWRYGWSSAAAHCDGRDASGLLDLAAWRRGLPRGGDWRDSLGKALKKDVLSKLRLWTHRGRPLGSDRFVAKLERALGRRLRPLRVGRPRKPRKRPIRTVRRKHKNR